MGPVESNDVLYAGDTDYQQEAQDIIDALIQKIMDNLSALERNPDSSAKKNRANLAMEFFNTTVAHAAITESTGKLLVNLHKIAKGSKPAALANCVAQLRHSPGIGTKIYEHLR